MPSLPAVPGVLRAQLKWSDSEDLNVTTTLFFSYSGGAPSDAATLALATDILVAMEACSTQWLVSVQLTECEVTDLSSDEGAQASFSGTTAGSVGGQVLAGGTCLVANYTISRRYRGGKPRSYLPWGSASTLENAQQWDADFLSDCRSKLDTFFATCIGSTSGGCTITNQVNVSYYNGSTAVIVGSAGSERGKTIPTRRAVPLVNAVTSRAILGRPGSQRRRNRT